MGTWSEKREELKRDIADAIKEMGENKQFELTTYFTIETDVLGREWGIALGWMDGFDEQEDSFGKVGDTELCGKVAYLMPRSLMTEYDMDWTMPYDLKTGEVYDTETSFAVTDGNPESITDGVEYLLNSYEECKTQFIDFLAVHQNPENIATVLKQTEDLCVLAVKEDPDVIDYISEKTPNIICEAAKALYERNNDDKEVQAEEMEYFWTRTVGSVDEDVIREATEMFEDYTAECEKDEEDIDER